MMKLLDLAQRMCDWDNLDEWRGRIRQIIADDQIAKLPPFLLLSLDGITPHEQRRCAELWMRQRILVCASQQYGPQRKAEPRANRKLRLGYLSADFHEHATALLLVEMLEAHDRNRFEVFAYSYGPDDGKPMRDRLKRSFDQFVEIGAMSDSEAAARIHRDEVDILIDLKGYTAATRTVILAFRPAPVQVNYLGYPGTLGGGLCDYLITDTFLTPPGSASDYSEALAYLPDTYHPHGRHGLIGPRPTRREAGLPEAGFVFCCFNQSYKITPEIFDIWCRLLLDVPDSVLWLLETPLAEGNLRKEAFRRGITAERIVFASDKPQIEHLGRLQLADLVLDTLPYNAHTTASDALWVGVPIMTCVGDTFPSRVAGSVLSAVGLDELITTNLEDYYELALELATSLGALEIVRQKLCRNRLTTPLFDIIAYTRHLESLYDKMWESHLAGSRKTALYSGLAPEPQ